MPGQEAGTMQWIWRCLGAKPCLEDLLNQPVAPAVAQGPRGRDRRDCFERVVGVEAVGAPEPAGPHQRVAQAIFAYEVFPPNLVSPVLHRVPLQVGDTVGILFHFLPGVDLFCGARVVACFDQARDGIWHTGFTYQTLVGHPELGEETFSVEKDLATGQVTAALRSWSRPGTWLTWLGGPYTRYAQVRANHAALAHLAAVAAGQATP
jgi:uncharacterized protein (UPF0548 family)